VFLKKLVLKLVSFSVLNLVRKWMGLNFDLRDMLGYLVVYAAVMLIIYHDSESLIQFFLNMAIPGSLFFS